MKNQHGLKLGDDISMAKIKTMVKRTHVDFSLYFDIKYETRKDQAICLLCEKVISRYGYGSTTSMLAHMKSHGIEIGEQNSEISYSAVRGHGKKLSSDYYSETGIITQVNISISRKKNLIFNFTNFFLFFSMLMMMTTKI